jgi:hypothetical protein
VPQAAADNIAWRAALPGLKAGDLALLKRLATADAMRAVWPKLTSVDAGEVVNVILRAEEAAHDLRAPLPKPRKGMAAYLQELGETPLFPSEPQSVANHLEAAAKVMRDHEVSARVLWPDLWSGERAMTFDGLFSQLDAAAAFYLRLQAEYQKSAADADPLPPPPRKRGSKAAGQIYFGQILSAYFKRIGGFPLDEVVGAITGVVFDDASGGPGAATVRDRRRGARGRKAGQT